MLYFTLDFCLNDLNIYYPSSHDPQEHNPFQLLYLLPGDPCSITRVFFADLTIAFVLVTVLSVPCSFGGWSVQIQRLEGREFWVLVCIEYVPRYLLSPASSAVKILCYIVGIKERKKNVSLKNVCTCGGMADVLIAAHDWLFFSQKVIP